MASEMVRRDDMQTAQQCSGYLGALIEDDRRLVLVSVDPDEPWEAFRRLRRALRKERTRAQAKVDIFEAPTPLERQAEVVSILSRRRAG